MSLFYNNTLKLILRKLLLAVSKKNRNLNISRNQSQFFEPNST